MNWISVKDRMPEERKNVLLYVLEEDYLGGKDNDIYIGLYEKYEWGTGWVLYIPEECYPFKNEVIYWMPLPDKPSEEKAGE